MSKSIQSNKNIAIVYDWVDTRYGGAEHVIQSLIRAFPQAVLFTAHYGKWVDWTQNINVKSSFIDRIPVIGSWRPLTALFSPIAFEQFDLSSFDVIISVTSFAAKGVLTLPHQLHISYILSPPRFVYRLGESYLTHEYPAIDQIVSFLALPFLWYFKKFDQAANYRPDILIPLSERVKAQMLKTTDRPCSQVCYPPIPVLNLQNDADLNQHLPESYYLSVGRLVPYKRIDKTIQACLHLKNNLLIVGNGPDLNRLMDLAGNEACVRKENERLKEFFNRVANQKILFLKNVSATELATLYQFAHALIALGQEDFGLTPLEAANFGTPAIINSQSGVGEILTPDLSVHVQSLEMDKLDLAFKKLSEMKIDRNRLKTLPEKYSEAHFVSYWQILIGHATNV